MDFAVPELITILIPKRLVTIIQIAGYLIAKFIGIKLISELKRENRLKFILVSIAVAELSLVAFGALPTPYNMFAVPELITIQIPKRLAKTSVVRRPSIKLKITPHIQPNDNPLKNMANIL